MIKMIIPATPIKAANNTEMITAAERDGWSYIEFFDLSATPCLFLVIPYTSKLADSGE